MKLVVVVARHYHHGVYVKNCALRENAHGLIAGARTPWQLFNTVSRASEHEATNCERKLIPDQMYRNFKILSQVPIFADLFFCEHFLPLFHICFSAILCCSDSLVGLVYFVFPYLSIFIQIHFLVIYSSKVPRNKIRFSNLCLVILCVKQG